MHGKSGLVRQGFHKLILAVQKGSVTMSTNRVSLLGFYVLKTSIIVSARVLTSDSVY